MALTLDFSDELRTEVAAALQQWPSNPQAAASAVRSLADREPEHAGLAALAAMVTVQAGPSWQDGLPYARRAASAGLVTPLNNYYGNMLGDPSHLPEAIEFMGLLRDVGWPIDPLAHIPQVAQAGRTDLVEKLVDLASRPAPSGARTQWEELLADTRASSDAVRHAASVVDTERDRALSAINGHEARVREERERMAALVAEVTDLANEGAAVQLAKEYAVQAKAVETTADRYTTASIALGAFAALTTCVIAYFAFKLESDAGAVVTKAALALPVILFAGYVARLAAIHRQQAWRWRHIELQIRTARPFVSPLDEEQRKTLIAALALRFFPGQSVHDGQARAADVSDPVAVLADLLRSQLPASDGAKRSTEPTGSDAAPS
jgi:hypothetical protein